MNIIDAYKQAEEGQEITRKEFVLTKYQKSRHSSLQSILTRSSESSILADDWEVVREKKTITAEIEWRRAPDGKIYPWGNWSSNPDKLVGKKTNVTIEWEE